ncbi:hypothetical protein OKW49_008125 [Paraburkholderia youngii]
MFLDEMAHVVPWKEFVALIAPHAPTKATGRRPFPIEAMLRIHFLQQWFGLSDVAMEEALYDVPLYREFSGLGGMSRLPDRVSILRFRHLLEQHQLAEQFPKTVNAHLSAKGYLLKEGTAVDATLIAAPSSTKNQSGGRDPEMHQTKKGNTWHFGMKAHIGVDADSGLVHTVVGKAANVSDVTRLAPGSRPIPLDPRRTVRYEARSPARHRASLDTQLHTDLFVCGPVPRPNIILARSASRTGNLRPAAHAFSCLCWPSLSSTFAAILMSSPSPH